ncbi:AAA family ATPase [Candidatus Woesearchaeota archaeon]|nr:AAA family ATPase [Candidatus Woesearchaeota archaeon]
MKDKIKRLFEGGTYLNSREINLGGVPYGMRDVLMAAPLIAGLNVYLVGGTGEGKTQLATDLAGFFGDSSCLAEGRPDFELSELLKQLNLGKLRDAVSDRDLVELTENTKKMLYYVDELNRCPPIVMNYFFNLFDGKLMHQGRVLRLGKDGYSVGYASGNIGNGAYVGISDVDRALKDRMHLIVKLDDPQFCTTEDDDGSIFENKKDPRATTPDTGRDCSEDILDLHKAFRERQVPAILPVLGIYLHKGLDYLESTRRHSKRAVADVWPDINGVKQDTDESKIMPLSKRAVISSMALSQAFEMIAESRGAEVKDSAQMFLDTLKLTVPYSGVLAPTFVHQEYDGDAYAAFDAVMERIRRDITSKRGDLELAIALADEGKPNEKLLNKISQAGRDGKWLSVRRYLEGLAKRQRYVMNLGNLVNLN